MPTPRLSKWNITTADIVYEDDVLLALNKPSGLPSQATPDPNRDHAFAAAGRYLHGGYVGLHHRIDAGTSGVLLLSKDEAVNACLSRQFQEHTIRKRYTAFAFGIDAESSHPVGEAFIVQNFIGEDKTSKIQKFCVGGKNRKYAETEFCPVEAIPLRDGTLTVFDCRPKTGRTHQIRVHLLSLGMPILGDSLYGGAMPRSLRSLDPGRLCLHAAELSLVHPVTGQPLTISAPLPPDMAKFLGKARNFRKPV